MFLKVNEIKLSPHHFRDTTVDKRLEQLATSFKKVGQVHAISVVRRNGSKELINGHRRWKAAPLAGMKTLRADIYEFDGKEIDNPAEQQKAIAQFLLAANMSEPLLPLERANYYDDAIQNLGMTIEDLADIHSVSVDEIREDLKFKNLSEEVIAIVQGAPDKFTQAHLKILAEYASPSDKKAWRITDEAR
jgi:ParB family chromosome partitioning protein